MTRINLIPVRELSDQHLIAEYRELPRCLKQDIDVSNAPDIYCLGKGHMKWARKHDAFLLKRYKKIISEMRKRGFKTNYDSESLKTYVKYNRDYKPTKKDVEVSRKRINEKLEMKPDFYKWSYADD